MERELTEAKSEIETAKQDSSTQETFSTVSGFVAKAKPYVEKIIKGANIALKLMALFI